MAITIGDVTKRGGPGKGMMKGKHMMDPKEMDMDPEDMPMKPKKNKKKKKK